MENVYKIKVRTNPDPHWLYPSERRYSASTVLGLGVVHLALALTALLLSCLTLVANQQLITEDIPAVSDANSITRGFRDEVLQSYNRTAKQAIKDDNYIRHNTRSDDITIKDDNIARLSRALAKGNCDHMLNLTLAPCIMCLGSLAAGLTALLAWKRWYIDQNIKWFFIMSIFSSITSSICLISIAVTIAMTSEVLSLQDTFALGNHHAPSLKLVVAINVFIASVLEFIWSILSSKIAYKGMINDYPDDIVISKQGGRKEICTVRKGNSKGRLMPPDILNHFPLGSKFAKYFPKKDNGYLPKEESNSEYQERVNRFLASQNSISGSVR